MTGFVAIHRAIWDNDVFAQEPMSEREAWIWMIAKAAWKPTRHRVGSAVLEVPRGSFFATLRELQKSFGWGSVKRVRTFLDLLEGEGMIERETGTGKTRINVCNYERFQDSGHVKGTAGAQPGHSRGTLKEQGNKGTSIKTNTRATLIPDDFWPTPTPGTKTANAMDGWTADRLETEVERFVAHHRAKGNRYPDWQRAWTTWALSDFQKQRTANDRQQPSNRNAADLTRAKLAAFGQG